MKSIKRALDVNKRIKHIVPINHTLMKKIASLVDREKSYFDVNIHSRKDRINRSITPILNLWVETEEDLDILRQTGIETDRTIIPGHTEFYIKDLEYLIPLLLSHLKNPDAAYLMLVIFDVLKYPASNERTNKIEALKKALLNIQSEP